MHNYNQSLRTESPSLLNQGAPKQGCGRWHLTNTGPRKSCAIHRGGVDEANSVFDLPNSRQTLLYFQASAGFPTKESFLVEVRAGNYATWQRLMTTLITKHFPDSDETQKGHMKVNGRELDPRRQHKRSRSKSKWEQSRTHPTTVYQSKKLTTSSS